MAKKTIVKRKKVPATAAKKPAFGARDLEIYRKKLEVLQTDLSHTVQKKREEVVPEAEVGDEADVTVHSLERGLVFEQSGTERHMLEEVEAALRRIEKGTFGFCESDSEKISNARLNAMPYARYCIKCQARFERV